MYQKLGIDVGSAASIDTTHLFTDEDLINSTATSNGSRSSSNSATSLAASSSALPQVNEILTKATKRKASTSSLLSASAYPPSPSYKRAKINANSNNKPQQQPNSTDSNSNSTSLDVLIRWLINNMFLPEWETRHGSATALREILKYMLSPTYLHLNDLTRLYIEDLLIKILIVIILDRFADYVGDEVIAPVRETCSQIIGIISSKLTLRQLEYLLRIVNSLIRNTESWEIRHSGILTLKYVIATLEKSDSCLEVILRLTFDNITNCIKDSDDDVRQVASQSLIPICERLNEILKRVKPVANECECLIQILVDVLSDIDDLATSCTSIMILLSNLLKNEQNSKFLFSNTNLLNALLQRVYPFLQHNNLIVKQTTLNALVKIFELISTEKDKTENFFERLFQSQTNFNSNLTLLFRLLYQQTIIECDPKCCQFIEQLWARLCTILTLQQLISICYPYITTWLTLLMNPATQCIEQAYLVQSEKLAEYSLNRQQNNDGEGSTNGGQQSSYKEYIGGHMQKYEESKKRDEIIINCRVLAARLLALLFNRINSDCLTLLNVDETAKPINLIVQFLCSQINYKSGLNRFCFGLLMTEWGSVIDSSSIPHLSNHLVAKIINFLDETTLYYDEIASSFTRIQKECKHLITLCQQYINRVPQLQAQAASLFTLNVFTLEEAQNLVNFLKTNQTCFPVNIVSVVNDQIQQLSELIQRTMNEQEQLQLRSSTSLASASISTKQLTEKMNPLIRPLVECIRLEFNEQIQTIASKHLAILMQYCYQRQPNPVQKIFKNLHSSLCNNRDQTPKILKMTNYSFDQHLSNLKLNQKEFYEFNRFFGILSIKQMIADELVNATPQTPTPITPTVLSADKLKRRFSTASNASDSLNETIIGQAIEDEGQVQKLFIEKRGAELTFGKICEIYQDNLDVIIPDIINQPINSIDSFQNLLLSPTNVEYSIYLCQTLDTNQELIQKFQDFVNQLQLIEHICSPVCHLNKKYFDKFVFKLSKLKCYLNHPLSAIRHMVSRCLTQLCKKSLVECMNDIIEYVIQLLDNDTDIFARQGSIEFVYNLLEKLNYEIVPYICLLIVPVLKRMTDLDWYIRTTASLCFATLIKLYPLEQSQILSLTNNENILRMQAEQKEFLEQLCDNKKIKDYTLSEDLIKIQLRSYQQAGVNWLAFLKRFNLHGILCDDMGLGKTLQSICILAGDYYEKSVKANDWIPSIIVCPTTLTNHWFHEIKRYANSKYLKPVIYSGSIGERENVKRLFQSKNFNVLIVSYDIVRHDVTFISSFQWNYCILDEGHLIKSTKTKLSKAIKQIYAMHRLILTGTPIQNNVCELWCLFDFLIPGYLGTEKQFNQKYARYIVPPGSTSTRTFERLCSQVAQQQQQNKDNKKTDSSSDAAKDFHQLSIVALESLHKQVLPFLLRRTKEEVLNDLPPKIIQDYYCEMSALQKELYQDFSRSTQISENSEIKKAFLYDEDDESNENEEDVNTPAAPQLTEHIFQALQYLRKVVNHPSLVLKPSHPKWNKLQAEYAGNLNDIRHSGKLLALKDLLHECGIGVENSEQQSVVNQHRVLIFCQLKAMIDIVENELIKNMDNVSYLRLDGTIPASERYNVTHRFNSDPSIDILLLTTQIGGLGLNLTGADTVIFIEHDWNPQKDLQAMDRAHRIGQTKVVNVYRLITKKTVEEKIMRFVFFFVSNFYSSSLTFNIFQVYKNSKWELLIQLSILRTLVYRRWAPNNF